LKFASGATAAQIVEQRRGLRRVVEHVGSPDVEVNLTSAK